MQMPSMQRLAQLMKGALVRAGAASLLLKVTNAILVFGVSAILARTMGPENYGVYAFALAVLTIIGLPAHIGMPQLLVRETAHAAAEKDWPKLRGLWRWTNRLSLSISFIAVTIVGALYVTLEESPQTTTLIAGAALIPLIALGNLRAASLRGLRRVVIGQIPVSVIRPGTMLAMLAVSIFFGAEKAFSEPDVAMIYYVTSALIGFLVASWFLARKRPPEIQTAGVDSADSATWLRSLLPLTLLAGFQVINNQADILIMGVFRSDAEVGVYRAVFQTALLVVFGFQAMNQMLQPHFAHLYKQGELEKLERLVRLGARAILALALPPVLALVFSGGPILELVFGASYRVGAVTLAILAVGQGFKAAMGSSISILTMTGNEKTASRLGLIAIGVNLVLNVILVPIWGGPGAAVATFASIVIWHVQATIWTARNLKMKTL